MKSDLLDKARADLAAIEKDHAGTVHKAATAVRASKAKLDQAERRVRDLEFSAIAAEVSVAAEQRRAR